MVVQPVTAPGNAPENPRFNLNLEILHLLGQIPYAENKIFWIKNPSVSATNLPCQRDKVTAPYPTIFHLNA
jgi:hypothetical protein